MADVMLVTGMHRSGTSLVASWCEEMGLKIHLGKAMEAHPSNPKGHFEDREFVDLQADAVRQARGRSRGWKATIPSFLEFSDVHRARARQMIEARNGNRVWGWKDPRSVLFLEEWHQMIPNLRVLLVWRQAQPVMASLLRRSARRSRPVTKVGWLEAAQVWKTYNKLMLSYKARHPARSLLVPLDAIINTDRHVYELIRDRLGLELSYRPVKALIQPELLHERLEDRYTSIARAVASLTRCERVEERLRRLSDAPGLPDQAGRWTH